MKHTQPSDNRDVAENSEEPANSEVLDLASQQAEARKRKFRETVDEINQQYAEVFRRLSE
jgi:hypothetical protein